MQDNCFPSFCFFAAAQPSQRNAANRRLISMEDKTRAEEMEERWCRKRKTAVFPEAAGALDTVQPQM